MRIGLLCPHFPPMGYPCGAADFVSQLATRLHSAGQEVIVLTCNDASLKMEWPFQVRSVPGDWGLAHLGRVLKEARNLKLDLLDVQYEPYMYGGSPTPLLLPLVKLGGSLPMVLTLHSQELPRGGRMWRPVQLLPYDGVIFYSKQFHQNMSRRFPKRAGSFLQQGFPANIVRSVPEGDRSLIGKIKAGILGEAPLLVYFGHIARNRGLEELLQALATLAGKGLRPRLYLASKFEPQDNETHRALLAEVRELGLQEQVAFTGRLEEVAVSRLFEAADLCVLPFPDGASFKNGSLAAAIEHSVPVVTTRSALTESELLESGGLRFYAPGNVFELTDSLESLLKSQEKRATAAKEMGRLSDLFSWRTYLETRLTFYQSVVGRSAGAKGTERVKC